VRAVMAANGIDCFVTAALAQLGIYNSPIYRDAVWLR
jgi:hypothetical protein